MARSQDSHATSRQQVPEAVVAEHRADWHTFTRYTVVTCVAVAVVLLLMLLFLRVL